MGWPPQWRYRLCFSLMIVYMCAACVVVCALLWNMAISRDPIEDINSFKNNNLVPICSVKKDWQNESLHDCPVFERLTFEKFVANGWTKVVHRAKLDNKELVAVKSINSEGRDVAECSKTQSVFHCGNKAAEKMGREIEMLKHLSHPTVVKMRNYCMKTEGEHCIKQVAIITELGEPLTNLRLLQLTWNQRLQLIQDLTQMLHYTEHSPLGSIGLADLRRQQFILVKYRLKLADLDDITVSEPTCASSADCSDLNATIPCIANVCHGYNARMNIQKTLREFGPYIFIKDGVPHKSRAMLDKLQMLWRDNRATTAQLAAAATQL